MFIKRGNGITKRIKVITVEDNRVIITWEDNQQTVYLKGDNHE